MKNDHDWLGLELLTIQSRSDNNCRQFAVDHSQDLRRARAIAQVDRAVADCGCRLCIAPVESVAAATDSHSLAAAKESEAA